MSEHVKITASPACPVEFTVGGTAQSVFEFDFPFFDTSDIHVLVDNVELDPGVFTVVGTAIQNGDPVVGGYGSGTVTLDVAVTNTTVTLDRFVVAARDADYSISSPIPPNALNTDLDKLAARSQDLERLDARAVKAPPGEEGPVLAAADDRAGKLVVWNADGTDFDYSYGIESISDSATATAEAEAAAAAAAASALAAAGSATAAATSAGDAVAAQTDAETAQGAAEDAQTAAEAAAAASAAAAGTAATTAANAAVAAAIDTDPTFAANSDSKVASQKALKTALDNVSSNFSRIAPVDVVFTTNISLSGEQSSDGFTTSASRALVAGQTAGSQNGVYVTAAGAWTRATDADSSLELVGSQIYVVHGTVHGGKTWICRTLGPITVGTTVLVFEEAPSGLSYAAGTGLSLSANTFSINFALTQPWTALQTFQAGIAVSGAAATFTRPSGSDAIQLINSSLSNRTWSARSTTRSSDSDVDFISGAGNSFTGSALKLRGDGKVQIGGYTASVVGMMRVDSAGLITAPKVVDTTIHDIETDGIDLGAAVYAADILYWRMAAGSSIPGLGKTAPIGTIKRIINGGTTTGLGFNFGTNHATYGNIIGYKNEGGALAESFMPLRPGDSAEFLKESADTWRLIGHQPSGFWQYNKYYGSGSSSSEPPEVLVTMGPVVGESGASQPNYSLAFKWSAGAAKIQLHGLHMMAPDDTPSIEFRQAGGTAGGAGKNTLTAGWFGAHISGRPFVDKGSSVYDCVTEDATASSPPTTSQIQGFAQRIIFPTTTAPSRGGTPGALVFMTCPPGGWVTPLQRAWISDYGSLVAAGMATHEAAGLGLNWTGTGTGGLAYRIQGACSNDSNYYETQGYGNITVIATDVGAAGCRGFAGIAMRMYGNHGAGVDFGQDGGTDWHLWRVNGGTRTDLMMVRYNDSTVRWRNHLHQFDAGAAAGSAIPLTTFINGDNTAGTGTGIAFQPSTDGTNGVGSLLAISAGTKSIGLYWRGSNNAAQVDRWSVSGAGVMRVNGLGAGTVTTNASGDFSSSSDETLKVMKGDFADSLPVDLPVEPGETRAIAAFRAVGRARLWSWKTECADIAEAVEALDALQAEAAAIDALLDGHDDETADGVAPLAAEADGLGTEIDAVLEAVGPFAERVQRRHELRTTAHELGKQIGAIDDGMGPLKGAARAQANAQRRTLAAQRAAAQAEIEKIGEDVEAKFAPLEARHTELADQFKQARWRIDRFHAERAHGKKALESRRDSLRHQIARAEHCAGLASDPDSHVYIGTTAQQLQRGARLAVKVGPDGYLRKDDRGELALHTEVLHDLLDMVAALKAELADARTEIAALRPA